MIWQLKPKPDLEALEEQIAERGLNRDDFPILNDIPTLLPGSEFLWESFGSLSSSRMIGYTSAQPIQISEISAYMDLWLMESVDERVLFLELIQRLDRLFLSDMSKRKPQSSSSAPPPRRTRR